MAVVPLKFRCYQCNGLLGVSPSKVGAVVSCPKCRAELIVPEPPEEDGPEPVRSPLSAGESEAGLSLDLLDINPEDIRVEPGVDLVPRARTEEVPSPAPEDPPFPFLDTAAAPPAPAAVIEPPPLPSAPPADAAGPPIRVDAPRISEPRWTPPRSRDVLLPRSAVATWSLFVLVAQALAFVAGLLAGHFVWRVH